MAVCDQILTTYVKSDLLHIEKFQERHFPRINKSNADNITQGFGQGFTGKNCVTGKLVTQTSDIYSSRLGTSTNRLPLALNISYVFLPLTANLAPNID